MNNTGHLQDLAQSIGLFIEYWGFKNIDGRVWAIIYLSDRPLSTPEIVSILGVSKGLISIAINELISYQLIYQSGKTTHGALTYQAQENIASTVGSVLRERELSQLAQTENQLKILQSLSNEELGEINISKVKLQKIQTLTKANKDLLTSLIKKNNQTIDDWIKMTKRAKQFLSFSKD